MQQQQLNHQPELEWLQLQQLQSGGQQQDEEQEMKRKQESPKTINRKKASQMLRGEAGGFEAQACWGWLQGVF